MRDMKGDIPFFGRGRNDREKCRKESYFNSGAKASKTVLQCCSWEGDPYPECTLRLWVECSPIALFSSPSAFSIPSQWRITL